jgi:hypothetical protein
MLIKGFNSKSRLSSNDDVVPGWMMPVVVTALVMVSFVAMVAADDLSGTDTFLCTAVQATLCIEDGDCAADLPRNVNIPQFIEVDLEAKRIATTEASGLNRETTIEHLLRNGGTIVFHGYEMGRAFSWVIDERSGRVTAAVATDGIAVAVFGACTPVHDADGKEGKE